MVTNNKHVCMLPADFQPATVCIILVVDQCQQSNTILTVLSLCNMGLEISDAFFLPSIFLVLHKLINRDIARSSLDQAQIGLDHLPFKVTVGKVEILSQKESKANIRPLFRH